MNFKKISHSFFFASMLSAFFFLFACNKVENGTDNPTPVNKEQVEVSGVIAANTTWAASKKYLLKASCM